MIDLKKFRQNPNPWIESAKKRGLELDFDRITSLDSNIRALKADLQNNLSKRKDISSKIPVFLKEGKNIDNLKEQVKKIKDEIVNLQGKLDEDQKEFDALVLQIPNLLDKEVPVGKDDEENLVIKTVGEKTKFDFEPLTHWDLLEKRDMLDSKRAVKISGSRFVFMKQALVLLEMAVTNFVFQKLYKKGFVPILGPNVVGENAMYGTGYLPAGEDGVYKIEGENLYLIGTSEVSTVGQHSNEVLDIQDLPKRYVSFSACYRKEAGSYGKDLKGLVRVHQFNKVEMVSFTKPEQSNQEHEFLVEIEEEIYQELGIPYQKMLICTGDLGNPASKKYDIEGWFPGIGKYEELTSTSNTLDYQARRINCKSLNGREKDFVHILNGTGATDRAVAAVVENFQTKDLKIKIPEVLKPYMMGMEEI